MADPSNIHWDVPDAELVEIGECRFCDNPVPGYNEAGHFVGAYQALLGVDEAFPICADCAETALENCPEERITRRGGITMIHAAVVA